MRHRFSKARDKDQGKDGKWQDLAGSVHGVGEWNGEEDNSLDPSL